MCLLGNKRLEIELLTVQCTGMHFSGFPVESFPRIYSSAINLITGVELDLSRHGDKVVTLLFGLKFNLAILTLRTVRKSVFAHGIMCRSN